MRADDTPTAKGTPLEPGPDQARIWAVPPPGEPEVAARRWLGSPGPTLDSSARDVLLGCLETGGLLVLLAARGNDGPEGGERAELASRLVQRQRGLRQSLARLDREEIEGAARELRRELGISLLAMPLPATLEVERLLWVETLASLSLDPVVGEGMGQFFRAQRLLTRIERGGEILGPEIAPGVISSLEKRTRWALLDLRFGRRVPAPLSQGCDPGVALERLGQGLDLFLDLMGSLTARDEAVQGAVRGLDVLRREAGRIDELPAAEAFPPLDEFTRSLEERIDEEVGRASDGTEDASRFRISLLLGEVEWTRKRVRGCLDAGRPGRLAGRERRAGRKTLSRLRGARRRLLAEDQDRGLACRMRRLLGPRGASRWETTVLLLVILVCSLLLLEMLFPLQPRLRRLLRITDSIVCILLLLELGFRLCLVRGRVRYFLRHFLTDLLPSIPFLAYARSVRALRLARLGRFARMFRVVVLAFRGIDRLTARLSRLLHWNVLLFEPFRRGGPSPGHAASDERRPLASQVAERLRLVFSGLPQEELGRAARLVTDHLEGSLATLTLERESGEEDVPSSEQGDLPESRGPVPFDRREIRFEEVVTVLLRLTPEEVRERLGPPLCKRIHRLVRLLDTPVVRHLPLFSSFARSRRDEPTATTAQAGRALGGLLSFWLATVNWFADLHGVVTGPQLVDRIGTGIAVASRRPAVRLLLLGVLFLVTKAVVDLLELHSSVLSAIIDFLGRSLGLAIVVLGAACLLVHAFGIWLRRLAGEATDVYEKTAEAQFINLLEGEKARELDIDRAFLKRRVFDREPELRSLPDPWDRSTGSSDARDLVEVVRLLHLDSLDGAIFHRSDLKTTEQLLGNLTLESIRTGRLRLGKKELKRTRRLDLSRERALFGPYFWFNSLFTSLQQRTAKLLLDYNRSCVPKRDLGHVSQQVRERHETFLARREDAARGKGSRRKQRDRERRAVRGFVTTFFHALHFLSADPERDAVVRERFGEAVLARLREDRRSLVRRTFGTYPFHAQPREKRTVNAHDLYRRYVRGGRVVLMPLWILLLWLRFAAWMGGRLVRTIVDLLDPRHVTRAPLLAAEASFEVARRKIDRMRKPVFLECLRLRARFDPEYLGVVPPGAVAAGDEAGSADADLHFIGASPLEEQEIADLRDRTREASVLFGRYLAGSGLADGAVLDRFLARDDSELPRYREEALRAMHIAFVIDWQGVQTLLAGESNDQRQRGEKILSRAALEHHSFARQLVTLRAVQTLSLLDVKNDLRMVHALGGYGEEGEPCAEL